MLYFIDFAYNGSRYHGSQTQPNGITVQAVMEQAFLTVMRVPVPLNFAGRTDAGVHAEHMTAHFRTDNAIDCPTLLRRLNSLLPADIAIHRIYPVPDDWHARFTASSRTYEYRITTEKDPFYGSLRTYINPGLDFESMNTAAALLLGKHDFASFCKVHTDVKTTFCTVTQAEWISTPPTAVFRITADRFLRNMVRAIVGTLLDVGRGKMTVSDFADIISAHNRQAAGQSAPPQGLYLTQVSY